MYPSITSIETNESTSLLLSKKSLKSSLHCAANSLVFDCSSAFLSDSACSSAFFSDSACSFAFCSSNSFAFCSSSSAFFRSFSASAFSSAILLPSPYFLSCNFFRCSERTS